MTPTAAFPGSGNTVSTVKFRASHSSQAWVWKLPPHSSPFSPGYPEPRMPWLSQYCVSSLDLNQNPLYQSTVHYSFCLFPNRCSHSPGYPRSFPLVSVSEPRNCLSELRSTGPGSLEAPRVGVGQSRIHRVKPSGYAATIPGPYWLCSGPR